MQSKQVPSISPIDALTKGAPSSFGVTNDVKFSSYNTSETKIISSEHLPTPIEDNSSTNLNDEEVVQLSNRQGFRLADYNFMVKFEDGNQISEIPKIYPLPNSPSWFLGMANVTGQTLPIFNLKDYFGIKDNQHEFTYKKANKVKPMLFVLHQGENATGIIIDGLLERLDIHDEQIQHNIEIPHKLGDFINNAYLLDNEIWYDVDSLVFLDEIEARIIVN